ncbi:MAG TPA: glycosyltransferase family 4 protein [candidate division Zixibacteria bacterium]|nr:glycosyltransferase family 4 protein [candidate division Zixibacteria bacterium]
MSVSHRRPKIAFLTSGDPQSRRYWSGTPYHMARALEKHVGEVAFLGPVRPKRALLGKLANRAARVFGKQYDYTHSFFLAKAYARAFAQKLSGDNFDLMVAPAASTEIAFLKTETPILYTSDATFARMVDYQPGFSSLLKHSIRQGNFIEQKAVDKAALLVYPTDWAAQSAIQDYGADPAKVFVVPYGANLDGIPGREAVLQRKKSARCHLLFLGVNWERKGGPIAFETLLQLEKIGLPVELVVCGCTPPRSVYHKALTVIPFLDKNDPAQNERLSRLFLESDFLLLPTRCECYGVAFCEAAAFALPVITTDTGGVSGVVREGENGHLLPNEAGGAEYARLVAEIYRDEARYCELVRQGRKAFEERLSWDVWAQTLKRLSAEKLGVG